MYPNTLNSATPIARTASLKPIQMACFRSLKSLCCCLLSLTLVTVSVFGNPAFAQSTAELTDAAPPLIEMSQVKEGLAGEVQVFNATVIDDQELLAVLFFYRWAGEEQFASLDMELLEGTNSYNVSIPTSEDEVRNIEYFVQAEDTAGNRAIKGFTFDPLIRTIYASEPLTAVADPESGSADLQNSQTATDSSQVANSGSGVGADSTQPVAEQKSSGSRGRLIWGLVGLVVVAGIAVALSDRDDASDEPTPITLNSKSSRMLAIEW